MNRLIKWAFWRLFRRQNSDPPELTSSSAILCRLETVKKYYPFKYKRKDHHAFASFLAFNADENIFEMGSTFWIQHTPYVWAPDAKSYWCEFIFHGIPGQIIVCRRNSRHYSIEYFRVDPQVKSHLTPVSEYTAKKTVLRRAYFAEIPNRREIPAHVREVVWLRDQHRCTNCGSTRNLQFDHIIPYSEGGAATVENIQILCGTCNRHKSAHVNLPARYLNQSHISNSEYLF